MAEPGPCSGALHPSPPLRLLAPPLCPPTQWYSATWSQSVVTGMVNVNTLPGAAGVAGAACLLGPWAKAGGGPMLSNIAGGWTRTGADPPHHAAHRAPPHTAHRPTPHTAHREAAM